MVQTRQRQASTNHQSERQETLPLVCGCDSAYWRRVAVDALLELSAARERLARVDEDLVQLAAVQRHRFYVMVGGTQLGLPAFRAKVRHELLTGEHI